MKYQIVKRSDVTFRYHAVDHEDILLAKGFDPGAFVHCQFSSMIELSAKTTCCPLSLDLHQIKMLEGSGFDLGVFKKICKGHHFGSGTADAEGWNIYWLEGGQGQEAEAGKGKETIAQLNAGPLFSNLILLRLRHGKEFKEPSVRARRVEANGGELVVWRFRGAEVVTAQLLGDRLDLPGRDACTYISTKAATSAFSLRW